MSRLFINAGDIVDVAAAASINNLSEVTYCGWYKAVQQPSFPGVGYGAFWAKDPNGVDNEQWIAVSIPGIEYRASYPFPGSVSVSTARIQIVGWYHIAFTFSNSGDKLIKEFINGVETTYQSQQTGAVSDDSSGDLFVGNDTFGAPALGNIYDFRLYNIALSSAQLMQIMSGGISDNPAPGNLKCQLTFDTNQGGTEPDASGNGNVGVITTAAFSSDNPPFSTAYSVPDCRDYATFPNDPRVVNGTKIYDVPSFESRTAGAPVDSRLSGAPTSCGTYPQNSRTPGTFGPGE